MISKPLFAREVKANYKILLIFLGVVTMYGSIIIAIFDPKLGASFKMMAESMPDMFSMFGMDNFSDKLVEFLGEILYGFIFIVVPLIFLMLLNSRLVTRYIDRGSMASLLATPNSRKKIIITQATISVLGNFSIVVYMIGMGIVVSSILFPGKLEISSFLLLNLGLFCLLFFLSGLCFAAACIFNEAKIANGIGMGACIVFLLLKMLSQAGDKAEVIKYATPITLFDPTAIIKGEVKGFLGMGILFIVGMTLYVVAIKVFTKKDLAL